jgi:hypothetical protein
MVEKIRNISSEQWLPSRGMTCDKIAGVRGGEVGKKGDIQFIYDTKT